MPHPWRGGAASDSDLLESSASDILSDSFTYRRAYTRLVDVGLPIYEEQNIGFVHEHLARTRQHRSSADVYRVKRQRGENERCILWQTSFRI